jgi:hypothetical protein
MGAKRRGLWRAEEDDTPRTPKQEKGHRLGIFITVVAAVIFVVGTVANNERVMGLGVMGVLFGYLLARLWYWFRSA